MYDAIIITLYYWIYNSSKSNIDNNDSKGREKMNLHWSKVAVFYQIKSEKLYINYNKMYIIIPRVIIRKITLKNSNMVILNYILPIRNALEKYIPRQL